MNDAVRIERFPSRDAATTAVAQAITAAITAATAADRRAWVCLSGGSSPVDLYRRLGASPQLPWGQVDLTLSDERWVPADDADSNEALVRRELLAGDAGQAATLHGLYRADVAGPEAAVGELDAAFAGRPTFDYCLLGMGADGHTASVFPDAPDIEALLVHPGITAAVRVPRLAQPRITLTPRRLLDAHHIGLLLFGDDKLAVLEQAVAPGPVAALPVRTVLHQQKVPVHCYWAP